MRLRGLVSSLTTKFEEATATATLLYIRLLLGFLTSHSVVLLAATNCFTRYGVIQARHPKKEGLYSNRDVSNIVGPKLGC